MLLVYMNVWVSGCTIYIYKEVAHLSVRLYFRLSLVSCCRAGYVCGGHLKPFNNAKGMKEVFSLVLSVGWYRSLLKGKWMCCSTLPYTPMVIRLIRVEVFSAEFGPFYVKILPGELFK